MLHREERRGGGAYASTRQHCVFASTEGGDPDEHHEARCDRSERRAAPEGQEVGRRGHDPDDDDRQQDDSGRRTRECQDAIARGVIHVDHSLGG